MNRAARVAWPALTILVALAVALPVAASLGGGLDGVVVGRLLARAVLAAAAAVVLGVVLAVVLVLPSTNERRGTLLDLAAGAAAVWTVAAATTAVLLYLGAAPAVSDAGFGPGLVNFLLDVAVGRTWLVAAILPAVLTAALVAVRSRGGVAVLGLGAAVALVPVALQAAESGDPIVLARVLFGAQLVHLVCGGAWLGLVGLAVVLRLPAAAQGRLVRMSAVLGSAVLAGALLGAAPRAEEGASPAVIAWDVLAAAVPLVVTLAAVRSRVLLRPALVLLGAAAGMAVAVDVAHRPDAALPARTSPAAILTGSPLPAPPSLGTVLATVRPDALWLVICAALLVGYLVLARRASSWPVARTAAWTLGLVLLAWLTSGGPAVYQEVLLSAFLAQHVALLLPVPVLLAAGAPVRLLQQVDGRALQAALHSPVVRGLRRPVPAIVLSVVVPSALVGTELLAWSLTDPAGAETSLALHLAVGCLVVAALSTARRRAAVLGAVAVLLLGTAGAAVLAAGPGLLHAQWFGAMGWGTDAMLDQRAGAVIAWVLLAVPTLALLVAALRRPAGAAPSRARASVVRVEEEVVA